MRTTINLDEELLQKVISETGEKDKGRAVNAVMAEFLRRKAIERLLAARGTFNIKHTHEEWEKVELEAMEHGHPRR